MNNTTSPQKTHSKDIDFKEQRRIVFEAFSEQPMTMLMAEAKTGIMRSNICWFVSFWEETNSIIRLFNAKCQISNHVAGYYSTNPELISKAKKEGKNEQ
jgi:hypothetical protein